MKKIKICKTCNKNQAHHGRTECISCINTKNLIKAKERQKRDLEKQRQRAKAQKQRVQKKKQTELAKKRFSRKNLVAEADRLFSLYIRKRDAGKPCITCGTAWQEDFQCGHFMSRRHLSIRWDEQNAHGQCPRCNLYGAGEQYKHGLAIEEKYGAETAKRLHNETIRATKVSDDSILEIIRHYDQKMQDVGLIHRAKKYYL